MGLVEGLQLDEELVHHARHAFVAPTAAKAVAGPADGVDLLDEADGAALSPRVLAQRLEVRADLAVGLAVEHGLERRRGDEEERHVGLLGHGLGHEGLARSRGPFEQDAAPWHASHLVAEGLVAEEKVDRTHDLAFDGVDPDHVVEAHVDLARAE